MLEVCTPDTHVHETIESKPTASQSGICSNICIPDMRIRHHQLLDFIHEPLFRVLGTMSLNVLLFIQSRHHTM